MRLKHGSHYVWSAIAFLTLNNFALGGNIDLPTPIQAFPHVDIDGVFNYASDLGNLDCGNGVQLPLRFRFTSRPGIRSPYFGQGWEFPLLDSHATMDENRVINVTTPFGYNMNLTPSKSSAPDSGDYETSDGVWKAKVTSNSLEITRADGYEMDFKDGRISSLKTPGGHVITWVGDGKTSLSLHVDDGPTILSLNWTVGSDLPTSVTANGTDFQLSYVKRPVVQMVAGERVISVIEQSLHQIKKGDQAICSFDYPVTKDVFPQIVSKTDASKDGELFRWDPSMGSILADGNWNYSVTPVSEHTLPQISRTNSTTGKTQSVFFDMFGSGSVTHKMSDGTSYQTYVFMTQGPLMGKVRRIDETANGKTSTIFKNDYDESGRLIRSTSEENSDSYIYANDGTLAGFRDVTLSTGNVEAMPQPVKDALGLSEKWRMDHPSFIAKTTIDRQGSVKSDSTHIVSLSDWRSLYSYSVPSVYNVIEHPSLDGSTLVDFPATHTTVFQPPKISGVAPESTIWNTEKLKAGLLAKQYSIGATSDANGTTITLVMNQVPPVTVRYQLDKAGQLKRKITEDALGRNIVEDYSYTSFDNTLVKNQLSAVPISPIVNTAVSWGSTLDMEIANNGKSN